MRETICSDYNHPTVLRPVAAKAAVSLVIVAGAIGLFASKAQSAELIEGTWLYGGGQVLIEPTGPGTYKGTVTQATTFASCPHPAGQRMWEISGSGTHYTGTHIWYTSSCVENPGGQSTWDIISTDPENFQLNFCSQEPGTGPVTPSSTCSILTRSKPPTPKPDDVIKFPGTKKCVSRRKFKVRVRQPKGIQIEKATISLNGKLVKVLKKKVFGKKRHTANVNLRGLPRGTFKLKIKVVTSTGDVIKGTRKYRTCRKGKKSKKPPKL